MGWLRRKFLTGLIILLPTVLTGWLLYKIFVSVDNILKPIVARYPMLDFPGLGFIAVIIIIVVAGVLAGNLIGSKIIGWLEVVVKKIPMINSVYTSIKQISEVFLRHERTVFKKAILVEYPRPGIYAIGFVTSTWTQGDDPGRNRFLNVFLPTTPNPTSGLFLMIPEKDAIPLDCTVENALKMVISGGAVISFIPRIEMEGDKRKG